MKSSEIKVGGTYVAKVSGKLTEVRVDAIRLHSRGHYYDVTNLATKRRTTFRSAAKFRREVPPAVGDQHKKIKRIEKSFRTDATGRLIAEALKDSPRPDDVPELRKDTDAPSQAAERRGSPAPGTVDENPDGQRGPAPVEGSDAVRPAGPGIGGGVLAPEAPGQPGTRPAGPAVDPLAPFASLVRSVAAKPHREPTAEQRAIIDAAREHPVLVVQAGAGAGKTTIDVMLAEALPGRGVYTTFVRALVDDGRSKFPPNCRVAGIHQLAFQAEGKRFQHRLNSGRVRAEDVAKMLGLPELMLDGIKRLAPGFLASQILGAIRRFCQSDDVGIEVKHFKRLNGLDTPADWKNNDALHQHCLPFARRAWEDLCDPNGRLPFNHDCYVKIWELNHPVISCDYLLVDECQDLSPVMCSIIRKQRGVKLILVGDSAQQIFEWRGAVDALQAFPEAPTLYLSQSFRFGPAIAAVANAVLETLDEPTALRLKGLPSIPSKVIYRRTTDEQNEVLDRQPAGGRARGQAGPEIGRPGEDQRDDREADNTDPVAVHRPNRSGDGNGRATILCRTNACAVAHLLMAMKDGRRPFLVGSAADVIKFVEAALALKEGRGTGHPELACFRTWAEVEAYAAEDEGEDLRLMVKLIKEFGCKRILDTLRAMPEEKDSDLVISTSHKAKGREWDHVQLAADFPVKSKCGDAEKKLVYVAVTRAKLTLDVSACPFFTGQDSLDISKAVTNERKQGEREKGDQADQERGDVGTGSSVYREFPTSSGSVPASGAAGRTGENAGQGTKEENGGQVEPCGPAAGRSIDHGINDRGLGAPATPPVDIKQQRTFVPMESVPSANQFTWTRFRDAWMIRGPKGMQTGSKVTVHRKNGQISGERLGAAVWENGETSIYRVFK